MPATTTKKSTEKGKDFAVIQTGGKQYIVSPGDTLKIERLPGEYKEGDKIAFDKVLLVNKGSEISIGTPFISGAKVEAKFQHEGRAKKVTVIKYKQKSRYFKKRGHRQEHFSVRIESVK